MTKKKTDPARGRVRYGLARKRAETLVERFELQTPPVNVNEIARRLGLEVLVEDLDQDISGLLITSPKERSICVNKKHSRTRQRFTIAHELGHYRLGHQFVKGEHVHVERGAFISQRSGRSSEAIDPKEIEANQFAACLLMPKKLLEAEAKLSLSDDDVTALAKKFGVSEQAMTIRLTKLGFL